MRRISAKFRLTLWYTLLMAVAVAIVMIYISNFSDKILETQTRELLTHAVSDTAAEVDVDSEGKGEHKVTVLDMKKDYKFIIDGVFVSVYNTDGTLAYGTVPQSLTLDSSFRNGVMYTVESDGETWYVYDEMISINKYGIAYVRGVSRISEASFALETMEHMLYIVLPLVVVLAAFGGFIIAVHAFSPIRKIRESAEKICDSTDLSQRIGLKKGKDEICLLANTFDKMLERLENAFKAEKQFSSDASHELRTPTAVIISQCEYALEHAQTVEEAKYALNSVLDQAQKISVLISRLLELARADRGKVSPVLETLDLSELTQTVAEQQQELVADKNIRIITDIQPNVFVKADETLIFRVLINLISNSIKYSKAEGGTVRITLKKTDKSAVCEIADDGIGIARDDLPKIWDRFWRADFSRSLSQNNGLGLGLSMVKWIISVHNGTVEAESEFGKGTTIRFTLPG